MAGFSIIAKLGLDSSAFSRGLSGAGGKLKKFGASIGTAIKAGVLVAGTAIAGMVIKGTKDLIDFEKSMTEVFTLMPKMSGPAMQSMSKDVRNLAKDMGVDLLDATKGMYSAISAGIPKDNAIAFLKEATKLAVVGVTDLQSAVGASSTVINAYNLGIEDMGKVSDVLFGIVQGGITTMPELSKHIGKVTPIASSLGITLEELGASAKIMTKVFGEGNTAPALTALKTGFQELGKAGTKAGDMFQSLSGKTFRDFIKGGGSLQEALKLMAKESERSGIALSDMFSSAEGGIAMMELAADGGKRFAKSVEEIADGAGQVDEKFALMEKSVARKLAKLNSAFHEIGLQMGEAFLPVVEKILPHLEMALNAILPLLTLTSTRSGSLSDQQDALATAIKFVIKIVLSVINVFGQWGDTFEFIGKRIKNSVSFWASLFTAGFDPIFVALKGATKSMGAFADALANPTDASKWKDAIETMEDSLADFIDSTMEWGPGINKAFNKGMSDLGDDFSEWGEDMKKRNEAFVDIWEEQGQFAILANDAAKDAKGELQEVAKAALAAGQGAGNLSGGMWNAKHNAKSLEKVIDRELVAALQNATGAIANRGGLLEKMKEVQDAAQQAKDFWDAAGKALGNVMAGKGPAGQGGPGGLGALGKRFRGIVRDIGAAQQKLIGGARKMARIPIDQLKQVEEIAKNSQHDAAVLQTVFELAQRAADATTVGMRGLTEELEKWELAMEASGKTEEQLSESSREHLSLLRARIDLARDNIAAAMKGGKALDDLTTKMDEVESILGSLTDELMKPLVDQDQGLIAKWTAQLKALGVTIEDGKQDVEELLEAAQLDPGGDENIERANKVLKKVTEVLDKTKEKEKFDVFTSMDSYLSSIDKNIASILTAIKNADFCCEEGKGGGGGDGDDAGTTVDLPDPGTDDSGAGTSVDLPDPGGDANNVGDEVKLPGSAGGSGGDGDTVKLPGGAGGGSTDGDEVKLPGGAGGGAGGDDEVKLPGGGGSGDGGDEVKLPGETGDGTSGGLALENTQQEVLDTLQGYFVNQ